MLVNNFLELFLESAPWLLLGLLIAGLLKMFVSMEWMNKQLGGYGFKTVVKAALFGAPLPLCSCGVIPAAVGLRRAGASKAATTTFMVSTPETGVDSVSVSYILLGPFMAIVRPIAAVISAIVAGLLVGPDSKDDEITHHSDAHQANDEKASCCSSKTAQPVVEPKTTCCSSKQEKAKAESSCCSSQSTSTPHEHAHHHGEQDIPQGFFKKIWAGIHYAATDLVRDTTIWLLVGIFFAAVVKTYVPEDFLAQHGSGIVAMLVMIAISVPMYICATASTPIAAGLLLAGISPGAVLVFMLAGPATNIATLGVVTKELGKRALYGYLGGVIGVAVIAGFITDYVVERFGFVVAPQIGEQHAMLPQSVVAISGIILAILMGKVIYDKLPLKSKPKDCCS